MLARRRGLVVAVLLAALALSACGLQPDVATRVQQQSTASQPAPDLSGETLTGSTLTLASLRGHPVVLNFWASWCGPCRQEQPELTRLAGSYAARGVRFVGVDIRDDLANARAYTTQFKTPYPSVFDPTADIAARFNVAAPPTTLVIDAAGMIRLRQLGTLTDVPAMLDQLLGRG